MFLGYKQGYKAIVVLKLRKMEEKEKINGKKCPLTISDWFNYFTTESNRNQSIILHIENAKFSQMLYSLALGSFIAAIAIPLLTYVNVEIPSMLNIILLICVLVGSMIIIEGVYWEKRKKRYSQVQKKLDYLTLLIIEGNYSNADEIRNAYELTLLSYAKLKTAEWKKE